MRGRKTFTPQTFQDGVLAVYGQGKVDISEPGDMPNLQPVVKYPILNFEERRVSYHRRNDALQHNMRIDRLLRVARHDDVTTDDTAVIGADTYKIRQVERVVGVLPPVMDLTLERVVQE